MRGFFKLLIIEFKLFLRDPAALFFGLIFPAIIVLVVGEMFGQSRFSGRFRAVDAIVPGNVAWVIAANGLLGILPQITEYRKQGIFRRFRLTPLPVRAILLADLIVGFAMTLLALFLMFGFGRVVFDIQMPANPLMVLVVMSVSYAAFFNLGFMLSAIVPSIRSAQTVSFIVFFPMFLLSGVMGPRGRFPEYLVRIGDFLPLSHAFDLMTGVWLGAGLGATGSTDFTLWGSLAFLTFVAVACGAGAMKGFKWE